MSLRRISLAFVAAAALGILAAGSVAAAGIDFSPAGGDVVAQATSTATPAPGATGNAGLVGDDGSSTPLLLGAALVMGAAVLAGSGRWLASRRS